MTLLYESARRFDQVTDQVSLPGPNIAATPTTYAGVRFRSKLESQWAMLFDEFSIPWVYEKEPFVLDSGCYLPDFWFPTLNAWGEVKPGLLNDRAKRLLAELTSKTGFPSIMLEGKPHLYDLRAYKVSGDLQTELYKGVELYLRHLI